MWRMPFERDVHSPPLHAVITLTPHPPLPHLIITFTLVINSASPYSPYGSPNAQYIMLAPTVKSHPYPWVH
jgi:hypothetical protein